jgi:elongation factor P--(R)-beta-lysine ligase
MTTEPAGPWWRSDKHADRWQRLRARGAIKTAVRAWFETEGFTEVEPGCLQVSPGNEAHLHAFKTERIGSDLTRSTRYLHTSPEFAMKKLLAAGETKIFAFAPCFRNRETGPLHAPEFTMLEWYRAGEPYEVLWDDCAAIAQIAARVAGRPIWEWRGRTCDLTSAYDVISLDRVFFQYAEIALHETYDAAGCNRDALARMAIAKGFQVGPDDTWSDIFSRVLTEKIEPVLGQLQLDVLHNYPASQAALARRVPDQPALSERFELYCCGVELANGFGELTDAAEQRRRFELEMALKADRYGERYPIDEDFLAALAGMPPACGCAMGFDRLVMLATGASRVDDVIWTPSS